MKKIIIIRSSGNELANQLWNYASIYAYSLEKKYSIVNSSFFEYGEYFNFKSAPNLLFRIMFFRPFRNYTKRKTAIKRRVWRKMYSWYSMIVLFLNKKNTVTTANEVCYLPPTKQPDFKLKMLENSNDDIYLDGWLFRNPIGLEKFRKEIKKTFIPRKDVRITVESTIGKIRSDYNKIVGLHIRQGDYMTWRNGDYFIEQKRVREIIDEFISNFNIDKNKTCFLIASDGPIDKEIFFDLNIFISKNNAVTDLYLLSCTDAIIGSNSTFGAFASYYGNVPLIVMQKDPMDWQYYSGRQKYFENKYSTFVQY
ncbi:MAG: alpha-1,2-fucosyltransferase [Patescibacteria group bacterium]